jgi:hypothetical protein
MMIAAELERRRSAGPDLQFEADLARAEREQAEVGRRQERLLSLYANAEDGEMPVALVQRQLGEAEKEKQRLAARIQELRARQREAAKANEWLVSMKDYCSRVERNLDILNFEGRRLALEALGAHVSAAGPSRVQSDQPAREWRFDVNLPLEPSGVSEPPGASP